MYKRQIKKRIYWMGAVDWDRRLFDSLIPLLSIVGSYGWGGKTVETPLQKNTRSTDSDNTFRVIVIMSTWM